jgi:hypothetical protein
MNVPGTRRDPSIAVLLSLFFPGAGYAYVGLPQRFVGVFALEVALLCLFGSTVPGFLVWLVVHVGLAIAAGGAARMANERDALAAPPPPPVVGSAFDRRRALHVPPPPPPPADRSREAAARPVGPPLDANAFLAELREAWNAQREGAATADEFAARKQSAIERVRVADLDDGVALLESTAALVGAGVMTEAERTRLRLRVGRR